MADDDDGAVAAGDDDAATVAGADDDAAVVAGYSDGRVRGDGSSSRSYSPAELPLPQLHR